jgi:uncharacterized protein YukE
MSLWVDVEHLATSAAHVTGHGEELAMSHLSADNRIAAAQVGWAGRSAEALANRASLWTAQSTALITRIGEHANDLHSAGQSFAMAEDTNARQLSSEIVAPVPKTVVWGWQPRT